MTTPNTRGDLMQESMVPEDTLPLTRNKLLQLVANLVNTQPKREKIQVQEYDGKNHALYPQFETVFRAKFEQEADYFPSKANKVWFAVGKLKGKAACDI